MSIIESKFPHVYIHFDNDNKLDNGGINKYLNYWNYRQQMKCYFSCTLDTTAIKDIDICKASKFAMIIAKFIKAMKKHLKNLYVSSLHFMILQHLIVKGMMLVPNMLQSSIIMMTNKKKLLPKSRQNYKQHWTQVKLRISKKRK